MADAFIYDHVRTPRGRGKPDGALHEITPVQLGTQVLAALRIAPALIENAARIAGMPGGPARGVG